MLHFVWNQFSGSLYRRRFRKDINFKRISWTLSSDPWFTIKCSTKNRIQRSRRNLVSYMARILFVSVQWIRGSLAFGTGKHQWKITSDPDNPPVTVFQMQFQVIWIEIPASCRQIAKELFIPTTIILRFLDKIGLRFFVARWVPYKLSPQLKAKRIEICREMLEALEQIDPR
jgi:hypothetical protein